MTRPRRPTAALLLAIVVLQWGCTAQWQHYDVPARLVMFRATVFDSLTLSPLRGARVTLIGRDTITATTDTNGAFLASLSSGTWRAQISHARFDSLRVTLPAQPLRVAARDTVSTTLWTPSGRQVARILCGDTLPSDNVALVGIIRDAATQRGIESAIVVAKWINLTLVRGMFVRSNASSIARTTHDGWYVSCDLPANGTLVVWAEHAGAISGVVPVSLERAPARLDLSVDHTALPSHGSSIVDSDTTDASLFPVASGRTRYRALVRDATGRAIPNARVRILGHNPVRTNDVGAATLDSVAGGTQTVEVQAIGYEPLRRTIDIVTTHVRADTFALNSLQSLLDTVRIIASRDMHGFDRRRVAGAGQFITAADVERANPTRTTALLRTRDGLRLTYDRNGLAYIGVTTQALPCRPTILIDGFPTHPVPVVPGEAAMDWLIHPDEIGGVEIYTNSAKIPAELGRWGGCATIAFWTRDALGMPKSTTLRP